MIIIKIANHILMKILPSKMYLQFKSMFIVKRKMNLSEPKSFNEKINYRKLYDKNEKFGICANKYLSKKYVEDKLGYNISPKTLWVGDTLSLELFESLPPKFIIKITNASGNKYYDIIENKRDAVFEKLSQKYHKLTKLKYGKKTLEPWYDYTKQQIIIEELLDFKNESALELKVYCFNNNSQFKSIIRVIKDRFVDKTQSFYTDEWEYLDINYMNGKLHSPLQKPEYLSDLLEISKKISEGFDFIRIDYIYLEGALYFGELTVADTSGFIIFNDIKWDYYLGEKWIQKIVY